MAKLFVVTGATGHVGGKLAKLLLERGHRVRAIGRSAGRLTALERAGAEVAAGSLDDIVFLTQAFKGADGVFAMIPPNVVADDLHAYERQIGETLAAAVDAAGVKKVVTLSSIGAQHAAGTGPIVGLHANEQGFDALKNVEVLHVRPGYFMENTLQAIDVIKNAGFFGSPVVPDRSMPVIATGDISVAIAEYLEAADFNGKRVVELHGERDLTMTEIAKVVGAEIGKPDLAYVQFSPDDTRNAMLGMGMSRSVVDTFTEFYEGLNSGHISGVEARSKENTTPTSIEVFARDVFAPAFEAARKSATA